MFSLLLFRHLRTFLNSWTRHIHGFSPSSIIPTGGRLQRVTQTITASNTHKAIILQSAPTVKWQKHSSLLCSLAPLLTISLQITRTKTPSFWYSFNYCILVGLLLPPEQYTHIGRVELVISLLIIYPRWYHYTLSACTQLFLSLILVEGLAFFPKVDHWLISLCTKMYTQAAATQSVNVVYSIITPA